MRILAIETSCDDTGVAVLEARKTGIFSIVSNIIASQIEVHKQYGGVYPFMAKREHEKNLQPSLEAALAQAKISKKDIDLIAVTNGPGLEPCLWVGVNFAKDLAKNWKIPLVPVNHIEAHILVNFLDKKEINPVKYREAVISPSAKLFDRVKFPAVALIVSGGHTQLILIHKIGKYEILGETRDDAAGECFDKTAKILGLGYPGGPIISKLAEGIKPENIFPRPMFNTKDYDFSFSGLKTAVLYYHKNHPENVEKNKNYVKQMTAEIQQAVIDVLVKKTIKAVKDYSAKTLILGGGVSANQELRRQFAEKIQDTRNNNQNVELIFPPINLSTDNAVMTAITAYFHRNKKVVPSKVQTIRAQANLRISK